MSVRYQTSLWLVDKVMILPSFGGEGMHTATNDGILLIARGSEQLKPRHHISEDCCHKRTAGKV